MRVVYPEGHVQRALEGPLRLEGKTRGEEFWLACPNPSHEDQHPSCSVNLVTGTTHCFACGYSRSLVGLASDLWQVGREEAERRMSPGSREGLLAMLEHHTNGHGNGTNGHRHTNGHVPGPYEPGPLDYMRNRGFSDHTLHRWGIRFADHARIRTTYSYLNIYNCIAIPVHVVGPKDPVKKGWIYRATSTSPDHQPRYVNGLAVGDLWFGAHLHTDGPIVVVEGPLDAMWCDQAGIPAIACMGSNPRSKLKALSRYDRITVLPDRGRTGQTLVGVVSQLATYMPVSIAHYPDDTQATDPCELDPDLLRRVVEQAIPHHALTVRRTFWRSMS